MADHDGVYKLLFRSKQMVRDTLISRTKGKWQVLVDWNSLEPFPTEQVSDKRVPVILFPENEEAFDGTMGDDVDSVDAEHRDG